MRWDIQWLCRTDSIAEWKSDEEIEWGFNEAIGRLIIKGKGKLEDYRDGASHPA